MRVAVIIARLGPYHAARLSALSARIGRDNCIAIEVASGTRTYAWSEVETPEFRRETLFDGRDYENVPSRDLREAVVACLDRVAPGIVAINGWGFPEARAALLWCGDNKVPSILMSDSQRRGSLRLWPKEQVKKWLVKRFDAALVAGTPHAQYVAELGMSRDRIVKGYDVVDNEHFWRGAEGARADSEDVRTRLGLPKDYFLCCSRFVRMKGLSELLKAYARYRVSCPRPWDLVLVGDGPSRARLERERKKLAMEGWVHLAGFKQYDELPSYYGLARAFVFPTLRDTWGLVVNEALAAGLPVIITDACGSSSDLVEDGENGFVVPAGCVAALAAALKKMSDPTSPLDAMARRSREIIREWSPDRFADAILRAAEIAVNGCPHRLSPPARPRVALVTNMVPPYREPVFRKLGQALGDDFLVIALSRREKNRTWSEERQHEFRLEVLPGVHAYVFARDWALHLNWGMRAALRRHQADVVIIGGWDTPAAWLALWAAKRLGSKVVVWSGSHAFSARSQTGLVARLKRAFVKRADAFFAYGTLAAEHLVALGADPERIVVGRNAVSTERFSTTPEERDRWRLKLQVGEQVVILYSGQLIKRKGVETLIRAMAHTPRNAVLWIVGQGPMRARYEALADVTCPRRVVFLGHKSYDEMAGVYAAADILVLPSHLEVWGLVVNEAMAAGLPVIASTTAGATPDLIQDGVTGLSFHPDRADALADALNRLVRDPDERRRIAERARALINRYDTTRYADDMYRSALLAAGHRVAR